MEQQEGQPPKKRGRKTITLEKKIKLIGEVEAGHMSMTDIAKKYAINKQTLSNIVSCKDKIMSSVTKKSIKSPYISKSQYTALEEQLFTFFTKLRDQNLPVSGPILKAKAASLALKMGYPEFSCSVGWFDNFKKRHNITFRKVCGEEDKVDDKSVSEWHTIISSYPLKNRFNMDETGMFLELQDLGESCPEVRGVDVNDYMNCDEDIATAEHEDSDGETITGNNNDVIEDEDEEARPEDDDTLPLPPNREAIKLAIKTLHNFQFYASDVPSEFNDYLSKIEKIAIDKLDSSMKQNDNGALSE